MAALSSATCSFSAATSSASAPPRAAPLAARLDASKHAARNDRRLATARNFDGNVDYPLPADPRACALCRRARVNPAALPSGFVFCYPCAYRFVEAHGRCPVTRLPCGTTSLRRVFEPEPEG